LGRELVMLSAELHYLRVKTTRGEALILYSFGQAMAELAASDKGIQVHRSHWVARTHVAGVRREEGRMHCVLLSGATVPVARSRQAEVAAKFPKA
jgi:DNA-binding LytR/AlgR family response regulator